MTRYDDFPSFLLLDILVLVEVERVVVEIWVSFSITTSNRQGDVFVTSCRIRHFSEELASSGGYSQDQGEQIVANLTMIRRYGVDDAEKRSSAGR